MDPVTMAPIQSKMIEPSLLTAAQVCVCVRESVYVYMCDLTIIQIDWLNSYHETVRETVGTYLRDNGKDSAYHWLLRETTPLG